MVRNYNRQSNNIILDEETILNAVTLLRESTRSISSVAKEFGINKSTLWYHVQKYKDVDLQDEIVISSKRVQQILSIEMESDLKKHLLNCADFYVGLSPEDVRILAYNIAVQNKLQNVPPSWVENKKAGPDWLTSFLKRHADLSIRAPEATSLARIANFNQINVNLLFNNLEKVQLKFNFEPQNIYNVDESGITTAHKPNKIVAQRGQKQIGGITCQERGELVTITATVSAAGVALPPFFIFPRVKFHQEMISQAPEGSAGVAHPSGWMNENILKMYLEHFIKFSRCSSEKPCLLLLDNHVSHMCLDNIKYAKDNGVVMVTFPPHTSHKLQPLDRSVFGPLKAAINRVSSTWVTNNPRKTMKIVDIPGLVKNVFSSVFSIENIQSGFRVAGIYPFNRNIFTQADFAPSNITDRYYESNKESVQQIQQNFVSSADIRPILTATTEAKKSTRMKGKTRILTDTPEMEELEEINAAKKAKMQNKSSKSKIKKITIRKDAKIERIKIIPKQETNLLRDSNVLESKNLSEIPILNIGKENNVKDRPKRNLIPNSRLNGYVLEE